MTPTTEQRPLTPEEEQLRALLSDQRWRLANLYFIEDKNGVKRKFAPNAVQTAFLGSFWWLNVILKARQLGLSTVIQVLMLDRALFHPNQTLGIIDKTDEDAKKKLRKMAFAYEHLDDTDDPRTAPLGHLLKRTVRVIRSNAREIEFSNGSKIWAGTSLRGGTVNFLHVSELGPIAYEFPEKAAEIAAGSLNTVHQGNIVVIESTHKGGRSGLNYEMIRLARKTGPKPQTVMDWKFFFYAWWQDPTYTLPLYGQRLNLTLDQAKYFHELETKNGIKLTDEQKHFYVKKAQNPKVSMFTEFPSTAEEALQAVTEGAIYGKELLELRSKGRIRDLEPDGSAPFFTFWDIGTSDYTCVWLVQFVGLDILAVDYYTCYGERPAHYAAKMIEWERHYGIGINAHYMPHDAAHKLVLVGGKSWVDMLKEAGLRTIKVVPRTPDYWIGIQHLRSLLHRFYFNAKTTEKDFELPSGRLLPSGLGALEGYHTTVEAEGGKIKEEPVHSEHSHGADALRTLSEAHNRGMLEGTSTTALRSSVRAGKLQVQTGLAEPNPIRVRPRAGIKVVR